MKYSATLSEKIDEVLRTHLLRSDGQEDLCFALWNPSQGATRLSAVIESILLPKDGERNVHGNVSFEPAYLERVIAEARNKSTGIVFIHSHPWPGWQDMSKDDVIAELRMAPRLFAATKLPLVGMTLGTDGSWSARFWIPGTDRQMAREWCESVRVVGQRLRVTFNDNLLPPMTAGETLERTVSSWGEKTQSDLNRLRIGIVGAGSVGFVVAKAFSMMGAGTMAVIDFDGTEWRNLDRLDGATKLDAWLNRPKVAVLARILRQSATAENFEVEECEFSVIEPGGHAVALDCDVLFCCVDRPWPRANLDLIAHAHVIPVIDGGIWLRANPMSKKMTHGVWSAHVVASGGICMHCLGQYSVADAALEKAGLLDDPSYIQGLEKTNPLIKKENVFAFTLAAASLEVLQFISMFITPGGAPPWGPKRFNLTLGSLESSDTTCKSDCPVRGLEAKADASGVTWCGRHPSAEESRRTRAVNVKAGIKRQVARIEKAFQDLCKFAVSSRQLTTRNQPSFNLDKPDGGNPSNHENRDATKKEPL